MSHLQRQPCGLKHHILCTIASVSKIKDITKENESISSTTITEIKLSLGHSSDKFS